MRSVGFVSVARLCRMHKMRATTNNILCEKEWPKKARNILYNVCTRCEPGPDFNPVCATRPAPRAGVGCRAWAHADLQLVEETRELRVNLNCTTLESYAFSCFFMSGFVCN